MFNHLECAYISREYNYVVGKVIVDIRFQEEIKASYLDPLLVISRSSLALLYILLAGRISYPCIRANSHGNGNCSHKHVLQTYVSRSSICLHLVKNYVLLCICYRRKSFEDKNLSTSFVLRFEFDHELCLAPFRIRISDYNIFITCSCELSGALSCRQADFVRKQRWTTKSLMWSITDLSIIAGSSHAKYCTPSFLKGAQSQHFELFWPLTKSSLN